MKTVSFDEDKLSNFKRAYNNAKKEGKDIFIFDGNEFVLGYAKYMIEYLEGKFQKGDSR
jgi:hypothetical protein